MTDNLQKLYEYGSWKKWVIPVFLALTFFACIQLLHGGSYNNILIFRYASLHLLSHQPLYIAYPENYSDYFLYHPSFTVLFMPLALLPVPVILCVWLCLSAVIFVRTVHLLPGLSDAARKAILVLVLPEFINNQQYAQTNILLVSLMLLVFIYLEKGRLLWAAFFTIFAFCIKGYGGIMGLLFLLYPGKLKFIGYSLLWGVAICALPLLFVSFTETIIYYTEWLKMIGSDTIKESISVVGIFGDTHVKELCITIVAFLLLVISLRNTFFNDRFYWRALLCCYLLVWVVLFNRAAESPTYQLAITGLAYWLVLRGYKSADAWLFGFLFLAVYIFPSDLFPSVFHHFFIRYHLKVYPFLLYFFYLQYQLIFRRRKEPLSAFQEEIFKK